MAKVLIIAASFNAGDAITMMNLFSKWDKRDLFLASPSKTPFMDYFASFYYLGDKECKPFCLFILPVDDCNRSFTGFFDPI